MDEGDSSASPARWTCEACGCRTNTETDDPTSCGVCGTRRANSIRRGLLASSLGLGVGYPARENDDEEDLDHSDGDGDDDEDGDENSQDEGGDGENDFPGSAGGVGASRPRSERERERAERAALRRRQNQMSDLLGLTGGNLGERFGLALAAGGSGIPVALAAAGGLGLHSAGDRARRSSGNSGSLIPLRTEVNSEQIMSRAQENASDFSPRWSASHCGRSIMVDSEKGSVACLTENGDSGRCIRTVNPLPGVVTATIANNSAAQDPPPLGGSTDNRCYGWKVMFEHPTREKGRSMGGCYLLGVTTEHFDNFTARNGLQQSKLFWGIEDGGRRYEGDSTAASRNTSEGENDDRQDAAPAQEHAAASSSRTNSNATSGSTASMIQLNRSEAPRNSENVVFGSKEVMTVVADMNEGKLNFWRDGRFIGTLVSNLPSGVSLYPVAVPFNSGVCVTITSLSDISPGEAMAEYKRRQNTLSEEQNSARKKALQQRREILLDCPEDGNGTTPTCISKAVKNVLANMWTWYQTAKEKGGTTQDGGAGSISVAAAHRLWYRTGIKMSHLEDLIKSKKENSGSSTSQFDVKIELEDFVEVVSRIVKDEQQAHSIQEEITAMRSASRSGSSGSTTCGSFETGDKVELCESFDRYGDAHNGPLRPGDVGTVVEIQRGSGGSHSGGGSGSSRAAEDRQSVRVLFNGRRWWYQPQALVGERSGLVEPPAIKFLVNLLRSHGYDSNLQPLWGTPVTSEGWRIGDLVVDTSTGRTRSKRSKKKDKKNDNNKEEVVDQLSKVGIICECLSSRRDTGIVTVSYAKGSTKKVKADSLVYTTWHHGIDVLCNEKQRSMSESLITEGTSASLVKNIDTKKKLDSVRNLDKTGMAALIKDTKQAHTLSRLLSSGLLNAIEDGIQSIAKGEHGTKGDVSATTSLGSLCIAVSKQLLDKQEATLGIESAMEEKEADAGDGSDEIVAEPMEVEEEELAPSRGERDRSSSAASASASIRALARRSGSSGSRRGQSLPSNVNAIDVRELVRDLGIGADQRRGVLLALMASERMHLDPRTLGRLAAAGASHLDDANDRNARNHNVFPFSRFSAEAALGLTNSGSDDQDDAFASASRLSSRSSARDGTGPSTGSNLMRSKIQHDTFSNALGTGSRPRRPMSSSTKGLISNGLMLDSIAWVKHELSNGADTKALDLEGGSVLKLALQFGCSLQVLSNLIDAGGCAVTLSELQYAAISNQPQSLELLLWNTPFPRGLVPSALTHSKEVRDVIAAAKEHQEMQIQDMKKAKVDTCARMFIKFMSTALLFCRQSCHSASATKKWKACMKVILGDVLLQAVHDCQSKALARDGGASSSSGPTSNSGHDGRVPAFGTAASSTQPVLQGSSSGIAPSASLMGVMSDEVLLHAMAVERFSLDTFFRLTEHFLWSKEIKNAAIGLLLASKLIQLHTNPSEKNNLDLREHLTRFGIRSMCLAHKDNAKEQLQFIRAGLETSSAPSTNKEQSPVIQCPKNHTTIIHLTKHSSFRCDLCGKGVPQGQPMHGCRACDWDACEACTDLAEGGLVKWTYILNLASECYDNLGKRSESSSEKISSSVVSKKAEDVARGIRKSNPQAIEGLKELLSASDGGVTLYEFNSCLLPAMYAVLVEEVDNNNNNLNLEGETVCDWKSLKQQQQQRLNSDFMWALVGLLSPETDSTFPSSPTKPAAVSAAGIDNANNDAEDVNANHGEASVNHEEGEDIEEDEGEDIEEEEVIEEDEDVAGEEDMADEENEQGEETQRPNSPVENKKKKSSSSGKAPLLRMVHTILAFHEHLRVSKHAAGDVGSELHSLLAPFDMSLIPFNPCKDEKQHSLDETKSVDGEEAKIFLRGEPLITIEDVQRHVLRCGMVVGTLPSEYLDFCRELAVDQAIIAEPSDQKWSSPGTPSDGNRNGKKGWRLARVIGFDSATGAHLVKYATQSSTRILSEVNFATRKQMADHLVFQGRQAKLILGLRDVCILFRESRTGTRSRRNMLEAHDDGDATNSSGQGSNIAEESVLSDHRPPLLPGTRVESEVRSPDGHSSFTVVSSQKRRGLELSVTAGAAASSGTGGIGSGASDDSENEMLVSAAEIISRGASAGNLSAPVTYNYTLVSDSGEILEHVPESTLRRLVPEARAPPGRNSANKGTILKRRWSALGLASNMNPLGLNGGAGGAVMASSEDDAPTGSSSRRRARTMSIDGEKGEESVELDLDPNLLERLPSCIVKLSTKPKNDESDEKGNSNHKTSAFVRPGSVTLYSALKQLASQANMPQKKVLKKRSASLYFDWTMHWPSAPSSPRSRAVAGVSPVKRHSFGEAIAAIPSFDDLTCKSVPECDGLDSKATQCLQLINRLAECVADIQDALPCETRDKSEDDGEEKDESLERDIAIKAMNPSTLFISPNMTSKLTEQLDDPLIVVGGALPKWVYVAPTLAPLVFSHSSRRMLLDRAAFGVSRSALKQQDAKIAVAPLRQRMAALRARAVELVGEAFSGGASDPTALQLQADELYAMEEALASRVNAAFRAQRWEERHLECAKAAIRRDHLLEDAAAIMETYAKTPAVNRRRLEVRFTGESGFDAAAGEEAGVTRGFYADVAEALLDCLHVAGITTAPCPDEEDAVKRKVKIAMAATIDVDAAVAGDDDSEDLEHMTPSLPYHDHHYHSDQEIAPSKSALLPLWIPDVDASGKTVIPTPRAQKSSGIGVFPRPLDSSHPQHGAVLREFRFIGRLFAAALRDKFLFPLPLSASFLKLVHSIAHTEERSTMGHGKIHSGSPQTKSRSRKNSSRQNRSRARKKLTLSSGDLPRPGFLGGEIYAVEQDICAALNDLEQNPATSHLSEDEMFSKREEIAKDPMFAKRALGKNYDCSFEDFMEGRMFVDPLDPAQDHCCYQLCAHGASRPVTIHNVREWVVLAKQFVLHDGIIAQAEAFCRGVNDFFSADALLLLTPTELYQDVCGGGDNVDTWTEADIRSLLKLDGGKGAAEALVAVAAIGGEGGAALSRRFGPSSPTIGYLVRALKEATTTQRRQFLSFVTSVPIVTPGPMEVVPIVSPSGEFLSVSESCMPRANTCARRLYLPRFDNYSHFQSVLYSVLREESQFKGFYEWRG